MRSRTLPVHEALPEWAQLANGWPVECGAKWLAAEQGRASRDHYITVVSEGARPVAAAAWMLLTGHEERRGYTAYDLLLGSEMDASLDKAGPLAEKWCEDVRVACAELAESLLMPCASVSTLGAPQPAVVWDQTSGGEELSAAMARLIEEIGDVSRSASQAFTNVPAAPDFRILRQELRRAGYSQAAQSAAATLRVPPGGMTELLAGLPHRRRTSIAREMRLFAAAVDRVSVHGAPRLLSDDIVRLMAGHYQKYGQPTEAPSVVDRLVRAQTLPDVLVFVAERNAQAIGFTAFVADVGSRRIVSRFSGCQKNDFFAFFNLGYYEPARYAAENGITRIEIGTESYAAKVYRGAELEPRLMYVRCREPQLAAPLVRACMLRTSVESARMQTELLQKHP